MRAPIAYNLPPARRNRTKDESINRYLHWLLLVIAILTCPEVTRAQGSPDVVWKSDYPTGNVSPIAYAPNAQTVFTGATDKAANLWRASDGASLIRVSHGQNGCGSVRDVAYSPDNTLLATINGCTLK